MKTIRFTKEGYKKLLEQYEEVKASRPDAVMHLKKSREMGDLSENGYYKSSRAKLSFIDSQIRHLSIQIKSAVVMDENPSEFIGIGSKVRLICENKELVYHVVGDVEADPSMGKISLLSPIGKMLQGKKAGEKIILSAPSGEIAYEIVNVE